MNRDFERTEAALASSIAGRVLAFLGDTVRSAWHSSSTGARFRSVRGALQSMPATMLIRAIAVAVMTAAALQPLLMRAMPATVVPAMPWPAFAVVVIFAAVAAWQAPAVAAAWPNSAVARLFRR